MCLPMLESQIGDLSPIGDLGNRRPLDPPLLRNIRTVE
jgi:hypothetical protein